MLRLVFLFSFGLFMLSPAFSQINSGRTDTVIKKSWFAVDLQAGMGQPRNDRGDAGLLQDVFPNTPMLEADKSRFTKSARDSAGMTRVQLRFLFSNRRAPEKQLIHSSTVAGIILESRYQQFLQYSAATITPFDTVTASNGEIIYLDSLRNEDYHFSWKQKNAGIQLGQLFHLTRKNGFSVYTGVVYELLVSARSALQGRHTVMERRFATTVPITSENYPQVNTQGYAPGDIAIETIKQSSKRLLFHRVCIPFGFGGWGKLFKSAGQLGMHIGGSAGIEWMRYGKTWRRPELITTFTFGFSWRREHRAGKVI